jgi:hypothetical protein
VPLAGPSPSGTPPPANPPAQRDVSAVPTGPRSAISPVCFLCPVEKLPRDDRLVHAHIRFIILYWAITQTGQPISRLAHFYTRTGATGVNLQCGMQRRIGLRHQVLPARRGVSIELQLRRPVTAVPTIPVVEQENLEAALQQASTFWSWGLMLRALPWQNSSVASSLARRKNHSWSCTPGSGYTFYLPGSLLRGREDPDAKSSHLRKAMTRIWMRALPPPEP